jgi:hypothetical protein
MTQPKPEVREWKREGLEKAILQFLTQKKAVVTLSEIEAHVQAASTSHALRKLAERGLVSQRISRPASQELKMASVQWQYKCRVTHIPFDDLVPTVVPSAIPKKNPPTWKPRWGAISARSRGRTGTPFGG